MYAWKIVRIGEVKYVGDAEILKKLLSESETTDFFFIQCNQFLHLILSINLSFAEICKIILIWQ